MDPNESRIIELALRQGLLGPEDLTRGEGLAQLAARGRLTEAQLRSLAEADPSLAATLAEVPERLGWTEPSRHFGSWTKYEVLGFHAEGGMGRIYKARDRQLGRLVALKFIARASGEAARRFAQEAQAQARVQHEAVCRVYEVGEWQGEPYIAMQFIDGRPLQECLPQMGLEEKVDLLRRVAEGLHAAHRLGLIHRDVKTGNIMVEQGEGGGWQPYVVDFGLARAQEAPTLTQTGLIVGTPAYMSPEQARGDTARVDRRSDVYSLGATLYEAATGKLPFHARTAVDVLVAVLSEEPAAPRTLVASLPADLEAVILKCLEKEPARRYESAQAVAEDLRRFLDGEPVKARQIGPLQRLQRKIRRHPVAASLLAASSLLSLSLGAWGLHTAWRARERAALAQRFGQQVEQIDAILRYAHLLPLHDLSGEKALVRERLARITADMARLGTPARGPGHAALGRGRLALREWQEARQQLETAWGLGQRDAGTAQALGLALANLYQGVLEEARRIKDPGQRARRKQALSTELRDRALACLHAGGAGAAEAAYIRGIIALQEERFDEALARAGEAQQGPAWNYEASLLEAEVHFARASALFERGDYDGAVAAAAASERTFAAALPVGRSDDSLRLGMARAQLLLATIRVDQGRPAEEPYRRGLGLIQEARQVDPQRAEPLALEARFHWQRAFELGNSGRDPRPFLRASIAAGEAALRLDPGELRSYDELAKCYWYLSQQETSRGNDGEAPLAAALEVLERGRRVNAADPLIHRNLGVIHGIRAEICFRKGADPGPDLATSVAGFRKAIELDPGFMQAHFNLGNSLTMLAMWKSGCGQDPRGEIAQAEATLLKAAELNPSSADSWDQRSVVRMLAAQYLFETGQDPLPELEQVLALIRAAQQRNPAMPQALVHRAEALLLRSLALRGSGRDPWPSLEEALRSCEEARRIDRDYAEIAAAYVDVLGLKAELLREAGRSPAAELAAARQALAQALARDPGSPQLLERRARVEGLAVQLGAAPEAALAAADSALAQARAQGSPAPAALNLEARLALQRAALRLRRGGDPAPVLERGRQALLGSLKLNPNQADARALQGRIHLVAAQAAKDPGLRRAEAGKARSLLEEALARKPFLGPECRPWLAEAIRLGSG